MMATIQDERLQLLQNWLEQTLQWPSSPLIPLINDASFRRYFRVQNKDESFVVMDAPPTKENCQTYVAIARSFYRHGLNVPVIHAENLDQGFLLLTDFGDQLYLNQLNAATAPQLYQSAIKDLLLLQACQHIDNYALPKFDARLYYQEMMLFRDWYLEKYLGASLSAREIDGLEKTFQLLIVDALAQPQVCTHRDYHSRNLMVVAGQSQPGILDFQDAVLGPITYDLLSLLRDCYIDWPPAQVENWVLQYQRLALQAGLLSQDDTQQFLRWFDWIGLQRHLKCLGIFARLHARDQKSKYLQYLPRIIRYMHIVCDRYTELAELKPLLEKQVRA
jgi:aminoglycoside/choline kinase family phosphotransferase